MHNTNKNHTDLTLESYALQAPGWPESGRHILAQYDEDSVVVYQAYGPAIGAFAACHGFFGEGFSLSRMSWIKPNFLWMMYRSGWGTGAGQEVVLAIRIQRTAFDQILSAAVHSSFAETVYGTMDSWKQALASSEVRLQWDPDHLPSGEKTVRRAIQLGLRGETLRRYSRDWIIRITDISEFIAGQREKLLLPGFEGLLTPAETVYPVKDPMVARRLGM